MRKARGASSAAARRKDAMRPRALGEVVVAARVSMIAGAREFR